MSPICLDPTFPYRVLRIEDHGIGISEKNNVSLVIAVIQLLILRVAGKNEHALRIFDTIGIRYTRMGILNGVDAQVTHSEPAYTSTQEVLPPAVPRWSGDKPST